MAPDHRSRWGRRLAPSGQRGPVMRPNSPRPISKGRFSPERDDRAKSVSRTGAPFLVGEARHKANYILGAIDHVLSRRPAAPVSSAKQAVSSETSDLAKDHIVLVIHGIRDRGAWQRMVQDILEAGTAVEVMPISYEYFDILRFLLPGPLRYYPVRIVQRELATALSRFPAHSFWR